MKQYIRLLFLSSISIGFCSSAVDPASAAEAAELRLVMEMSQQEAIENAAAQAAAEAEELQRVLELSQFQSTATDALVRSAEEGRISGPHYNDDRSQFFVLTNQDRNKNLAPIIFDVLKDEGMQGQRKFTQDEYDLVFGKVKARLHRGASAPASSSPVAAASPAAALGGGSSGAGAGSGASRSSAPVAQASSDARGPAFAMPPVPKRSGSPVAGSAPAMGASAAASSSPAADAELARQLAERLEAEDGAAPARLAPGITMAQAGEANLLYDIVRGIRWDDDVHGLDGKVAANIEALNALGGALGYGNPNLTSAQILERMKDYNPTQTQKAISVLSEGSTAYALLSRLASLGVYELLQTQISDCIDRGGSCRPGFQNRVYHLYITTLCSHYRTH